MDEIMNMYPASDDESSDSDTDDLRISEKLESGQSLPSGADDLLSTAVTFSLCLKDPRQPRLTPAKEDSSSSDSDDSVLSATSVRTTISTATTISRRPPSPYDGFHRKLPLDSSRVAEDFHLLSSAALTKTGTVRTIVDNVVVVEALRGSPTLNLDSVLFLNPQLPLGRIFDVFGPVICPMYSLLFEEEELDRIVGLGLIAGADVFVVPSDPQLTTYVFVNELRKERGTDASWEENSELPEEILEFSDDEKERAYQQEQQRKKRSAISLKNAPFHGSPAATRAGGNKPAMALPRPLKAPQVSAQRHMANFGPPVNQTVFAHPEFGSTSRDAFGAGQSSQGIEPGMRLDSAGPLEKSAVSVGHGRSLITEPKCVPVRESMAQPVTVQPFVGMEPQVRLLSVDMSEKVASASVILARPLITDPKLLPSAEVLFFNPKTDIVASETRPKFPPQSFLR